MAAGIFSAAQCGAPHMRKRLFLLAADENRENQAILWKLWRETILWPTPTVNDAETRNPQRQMATRKSPGLETLVRMWPTPTVADAGDLSPMQMFTLDSPGLSVVVRFPTVTVSGNYNRRKASAKSGDGFGDGCAQEMLPAPTLNGPNPLVGC